MRDAFMKRMDQRGQGGFTLIELLVVIAILAILAGVVIFAVGNSTNNAKTSSCKTELAAVKTAIAASDVASQTGSVETPGSYLDTTNAAQYWTFTGAANPYTPTSVTATVPCS
jgi:prepilin-type N-terminal cleavage/methylation domain-containing protein